jgi:hypothetical protein
VLEWRQFMPRTFLCQGVCAAAAALLLSLPAGVTAQATSIPRPATAQPPAPPVPPQPANPLDAAAKEALQQYSAALESLDADQVKKIHPGVDVEGLRRAFREMRELKVSIDNVRVLSTEGATARVSCRVTQTLTPKAGSRQTTAVTRVLKLRRQEATWLIDGFER